MSDKTILIVDGDKVSLNYLKHSLQEQQYSVLGAGSGKEGLIFIWRDHPDLIIFDPAIQDISTEDFLQKLRHDPRSASIPIFALSSSTATEKKDICLQAGCNEYMQKSGEAIAALPEIVSRLLGVKQEIANNDGFLLVFLSAKGGIGTSSLCANFAMTIRNNMPEASVVVLDLVLPIGSIAPIVGYEGAIDLVSVANLPPAGTTRKYFHEHLPEIDLWKFQLLAGATDPEGANNLNVMRIPEIIRELQASYDYVVVDLGRSLSRINLPIIQKADLLVLTVSTDQSTITNTKTIWEYLQAQGIDAQTVYAILNRAVGLEGLTKAEAEDIIGLRIRTMIPYLGSNFALANNLHQPIIAKYPNDTAAIIFKETADDMIKLVNKLRNK